MPALSLLKRDWTKDHVYLVQYPRCKIIPNASPWSLKLETWLRMANLPYTNISNEFKKFSSKGQAPFIEINGRQIADTPHIIKSLEEDFHKTDLEPSSDADRALSIALTALIEENFVYILFAWRVKEVKAFVSENLWGRHLGRGVKAKITSALMVRKFGKMLTTRLHVTGAGRLTDAELLKSAATTLDALSCILNTKKYFFGSPTTIDATTFSVLAQIYYTSNNKELTQCLEERKNLVDFVVRMREKYWPDWDETCASMDMNIDWKKKLEG